MPKKLLLCDCLGSQPIDAATLDGASGMSCSRVHSALCTREAGVAAAALAEGETVIACQQERAFFEELGEDAGTPAAGYVDLRDRAGWSAEAEKAGPKMAALLALAELEEPSPRALDVASAGTCLIFGAPDAALRAADQLAEALAVTVLLPEGTPPPEDRRFDAVTGTLRRVTGALGQFETQFENLAQVEPGGRGALDWGPAQPRAASACDIILDLSGAPALVPAPEKREGYLRADPRDPWAVAAVLTEAVQLVGTFEKPLYLRLEESLCAHSRAGQVGCSNCLDICPTGAISPAGDHVAVDPMVCAGCGACAALCPSGAITYDAPAPESLFRRFEVLARSYRKAGGPEVAGPPRLLVHDAGHGREAIALAARHFRGLPAAVLPLELDTVSGFGHAEALAALACGFASVEVALSPRTEREALAREVALAEAMAGPDRLRLIEAADPEALSDALYDFAPPPPLTEPVLPMGTRRNVARLGAQALNPGAEAPLPLPEGAPYGAVLVDREACTLCLSCVSLCPSGALVDNPDRPELRFQEDACLQCGICRTICPEQAITLEPRMHLGPEALTQQVLNEEEPFACIECGTLFGVRSTIEKITEKLAGKHAMFASSDAARMIQMCDDCRVNAQYHAQNAPFAGPERPRPRTTEDYFSKRRDH